MPSIKQPIQKQVRGPRTEFAQLVDQGVRAYQHAQKLKLLGQAVQYLSGAVGIGRSTLESWRQARYPRDYTILLSFAAVCVNASPELGIDWVRDLFRAGEMAAYASLAMQQIFGETQQLNDEGIACVTCIAIWHHSLEHFPIYALRTTLPAEWECSDIQEVVIDQSDLCIAGHLQDPRAAVRRQWDLNARVTALLKRYPDARVAYYGLAHIPLLFMAGYHLSNKYPLNFFEHNRRNGKWELLKEDADGPELSIEGLPDRINSASGAVTLRLSISYEITSEIIAGLVPHPLADIHLRLPHPHLDPITSDKQLQAYSATFRTVLDAIHHYLPNAHSIHVFYAGPVCLALNCGRQVSKTIHPRLFVYNYLAQANPPYQWGLDITTTPESPELVVLPAILRGEHNV